MASLRDVPPLRPPDQRPRRGGPRRRRRPRARPPAPPAATTSSCSTPTTPPPCRRCATDWSRHALRAAEAAASRATPGGRSSVLDQHRLLCAHRDGPWGVGHWNRAVERGLAEHTGLPIGGGWGQEWYAGRPLLLTSNDYGLDLFNGDTGVVVADGDGVRAAIATPHGPRLLATSRLTDVDTMHAMTVHKSQGSQAAEVTVLLPPDDSPPADPRALLHRADPRRGEGDRGGDPRRRTPGRRAPRPPGERPRRPARPPVGTTKPERHAPPLGSSACCCCASSCPTCPGHWVGWRARSARRAATSRRSRSSRSAYDGTAVDDVLLDMVDGAMPDSVVSACNAVEGVKVLWISRYLAGGNLFLDLEVVESLTAEPETALDRLVELLPVAFRCEWAARIKVARRRLPDRARQRGRAAGDRPQAGLGPRRADHRRRPGRGRPGRSQAGGRASAAAAARSSSTPSWPGSATWSAWPPRSPARCCG